MAWLHPLLLTGLALTAIPVILHLLLRAKPKKLLFPALRLIQNRRRENVQRLRLRHLWLLLLRMAVIGLLVFAVARPRVPAADYAPSVGDWLRFVLLSGTLTVIYFGLMQFWRRSQFAPHVLSHRRSLLRMGLTVAGLVLFALLVAWPYQHRIAAAITQPTIAAGEHLPVAAVLLFDTSLSMQYQHESQTRLDAAKKIARAHVTDLPSQSRVAIADTSNDDPIRFQSDLSGVTARLDALETHPAARPLHDRLETAVQLHLDDYERAGEAATTKPKGEEDALREIYVFTDLAASGWRKDDSARLKDLLNRLPGLNIYLIDVGVPEPLNVGLTSLSLSEQTVSTGSETTIRVNVEMSGGEPADKTVEVFVENESGKLVKQGQTTVKADRGAAVQAQFLLRGLTGTVKQGEIRLSTSDPLAFDDVQHFTLRVQPPREILVVSDQRADAQFWIEALAPTEMVRLGKARYRCTFTPTLRLTAEDLKKYAVVCLINVADPTAAGWNALGEYLKQGGGLAMMLGGRVNHPAYLSPAARSVLPAELLAPLKFTPPEYLDLQNVTHPLFKKFTFDWGVAELTSVEIQRYWSVEPGTEGAVIARFTNQRRSPAFVERGHGKGISLLMTTAVDRTGWNDLPASGWSFVALADQTMQYLSRSSESQFNFTAGTNVVVDLNGEPPPGRYLLRKPRLQQLPGETPPGATTITLRDLDQLGNYRLIGAEADSKFEHGFSVNANPAESHLARLTDPDLEALFGKDRYSVSQTIEGLQKKVQIGRVGREAYPVLLALLIFVFIAENFVSNRFYREPQTAAQAREN